MTEMGKKFIPHHYTWGRVMGTGYIYNAEHTERVAYSIDMVAPGVTVFPARYELTGWDGDVTQEDLDWAAKWLTARLKKEGNNGRPEESSAD